MNSAVSISVCLPSYNGERFIAETIQAVLNQSFNDFELIVCDDCSMDDTVRVVRTFNDPRIRLLQNEKNLGMGGNWNRVLSLSRGKYVKLLCEDDLLHPECFAQQWGILERSENRRVVLTVCGRNVVNEQGEEVFKARRPRTTGIVNG